MPEVDERHLDALLAHSAETVSYPPFAPLRPRVLAALAAAAPGEPAPRPARWRLATVAFAAALAVVALVTLALPSGRSAVADFFGIFPGQRIEVIERTPSPSDTETPTATSTPRAGGVVIPPPVTPTATPVAPRAVTLQEAPGELGFAPAVPAPEAAGDLEAAYVVDYGGQPLLVLQYASFDLWQTRGYGFFGKGVSAEATLEEFEINGSPAVWLVSAGHQTAFFDKYGREILGSRRAVDRNALIWRGADNYYRMETELPFEEALEIAQGLP